MNNRKHMLGLSAVVGMITLAGISAFAGTVSAVVDSINGLSSESYFTDVSGVVNANEGAADAKIASGIIDNNSEDGWKLTVTSANEGKLIRNAAPFNQIQYSNIELVQTGGTLGDGLTNPNGSSKSVTGGSCVFNTVTMAATSATVGYAFELRIGWAADSALTAGTYEDTVTMTLAVDA